MRAAIYVRQSLDREGNELGIDRQLAQCRSLCAARGWQVAEVVRDNNVSASRGERPGYRQLLDLMERQAVDVVVVLRLDRLLRRLTELEAFIELSERVAVPVATVDGCDSLKWPHLEPL